MPFETFRRNQRPLLAVFALMAMFAFVVSDSLINFISGNGSGLCKPDWPTCPDRIISRAATRCLVLSGTCPPDQSLSWRIPMEG